MQVDLENVGFVGSGLNRPECVVAHSSGLLLVPDWTDPGGISLITPAGNVHRILASKADKEVDLPVRPNGIALEPGGSILVAHLGAERGGIYRLWPDGHTEVVIDRINDQPMPPANFVLRDGTGRLWITISTTKTPRAMDYRRDACSGYVALHDDAGTRIVAEGLGYTNECMLSADEKTLWVNETFARRLSAFDVAGGTLANYRTVVEFGRGIYPDGLTPAADGSIVVTSIVSNSVLRVLPNDTIDILLHDTDDEHVGWVEAAYEAGEMGRPHLDQVKSRKLRNVSNLAFGGPDLKMAYLGCLLGEQIAAFTSPIPGRALPHWNYDLGSLADFV